MEHHATGNYLYLVWTFGLYDFSYRLFYDILLSITVLSFLSCSHFASLIVLFNIQNGHFDRENFSAGSSMPSSPGQKLCAAVSASTWVEPHGRCTVVFALAWSSPKVKFQKGCTYNRLVSPCCQYRRHLLILFTSLFIDTRLVPMQIQLIKYYVS